MGKRARRWMVAAIGLWCVLALARPTTAAADEMSGDPVRKLGRGLANLVLSVSEVPLTIMDVSQAHGSAAATFYGPLKGLWNMGIRAGAGAIEIVTFPLPLPSVGYGPILEPEFPRVIPSGS